MTNTTTRLVALMLLIGACSTQRAWVYKPNSYGAEAGPRTGTAVVTPFQDNRLNENTNMTSMYLIPVMPFGWADYAVPEGAQIHVTSGLWLNYKPTEDYAKALADELRNAGIFEQAHFGFDAGGADYLIQGRINSTEYSGKIISYGLSAFGPMLWFIGLPAATASNQLSIQLTCHDRESGETILSKEYTAPEYSAISWLYVMKSDFNYPEMLAGVYRDFIHDLRTSVR